MISLSRINGLLEDIQARAWMDLNPSLLTKEQQMEQAFFREEKKRLRALRSAINDRIGKKVNRLQAHMLRQGRGLEFDRMRWAGRFDIASQLGGYDAAYRDPADWTPEAFQLEGFPPGGWRSQEVDLVEPFIDKLIEQENVSRIYTRNHR